MAELKIDLTCSQRHYYEHSYPIWEKLPERLKGDVHRVRASVSPPADHTRICMVAGWPDVQSLRGRHRMIYVEHGAGQGYCLAPETRILTADLRWKPVSDLTLGEEIIAFEEERSDRHWRKWQRSFVTGSSRLRLPCYRLLMADGTELVASADHKWLRREKEMFGWLTTADLQDLRTFPSHSSKLVKPVDVWDEDISWGAGYLAAAFDGEGCLTQTRRGDRQNRNILGFSQRDNGMLKVVLAELAVRGFSFGLSQVKGTNGDVHNLALSGGLREVLRLLGSIRPRRLMDNFKPISNGQLRGSFVEVLEKEFIGEQDVVGIQTSTGTLIAEGFASHNSNPDGSPLHFPGYSSSGGSRHKGVIGFIAPNDVVASRWKTAPSVAVGCPKMDQYLGLKPAERKSVCFAWHFESGVCPEARSAWDHYKNDLTQIVAEFERQGWTVYGHAHPRWRGLLDDTMTLMGMEVLPTDWHVFRSAGVLIVDNSSLATEFMLLDRPVVWLNAPWYRRNVHHGGRFWEWADAALVLDGPDELWGSFLNDVVVLDGYWRIRREALVRQVYKFQDGSSSQRAADWITELVDALP